MTVPDDRRSTRGERVACSVIVVVIAVVIVGSLITNRNFWFDEAMAFQAIRLESFLPPGQALANYEQAMPYGVYVIFKLLVDGVGLNETVLRLPSLIAYVLGLLAIASAARSIRGGFGRVAAVVVAGLAFTVVLQAAMFKPYIFEFACSSLIIAAGWRVVRLRASRPAILLFFGVSVLSVIFSNTGVITTASTAIAVLIVLWATNPRILFDARWRLLLAAVVYVCIFFASYIFVTRPASAYQLSLPFYSSASIGSLARAVAEIYAPTGRAIFLTFGVAVGVVIAAGLAFFRRRTAADLFPFIVLGAILLSVTLTTVAGIAPFSSSRQLLFAVPAIGLSFGAACQFILDASGSPLRRSTTLRISGTVIVTGVAAGILGVAMIASLSRHEEVGRVLSAGDQSCDATYTSYSYQPAAQAYIERDHLGIELEGVVPTRSGYGHDSWFQSIRDDIPAYQRKAVRYFRAAGSACLLDGPQAQYDTLLPALRKAGIDCSTVAVRTGAALYKCETS